MTAASKSADRCGSIEELCDRHLGARPSAASLELMRTLPGERAEVREFIERALRLMKMAKLHPRHLSPGQAHVLAVIIPGLLPGSWGGVVPPFTWEQRHKRIDDYLACNPWANFGPGTVLLDMGCGLPPQTAIDTARCFPDWQVIGADPNFDPFVLHDADGSYACLRETGSVRYFHPAVADAATLGAMYRDTSHTFRRFEALFAELAPLLPADSGECQVVERRGARLLRNPMKTYERSNLRLVQAGIGAELPPVNVIRCFNVLYYFDSAFRQRTEAWALRTLKPGGLLVCGGDARWTHEARYSVCQRERDRLVTREFAFSLDNLRPWGVVPWFCLHEDERETWSLARMLGVLRSDDEFAHDYDSRMDALLGTHAVWERRDGFLVAPASQLPAAQWAAAIEGIHAQLDREGFVDRAVRILQRAGYQAKRNSVGHIAVQSGDE